MVRIFVSAVCVFLMRSCEVSDERLHILNNTNRPVYFVYSKGYELNEVESVSLFVDPEATEGDTSYVGYLPAGTNKKIDMPFTWEGYIENTPGENVNFFFFPVDTLSKYTWDEIKAKNRYSERITMSLTDLEKNNWTVVYPKRKK